jgi:eukaryotic-like serine/threonine-protein kinase
MLRDSSPVVESGRFPYKERVAEILEAALDLHAAERSEFLDKACGKDTELRQEIESLLGFEERARDFIEAPAYEVASKILTEADAELKAGQILGDYRILSLLGEGCP